MTWFWLGKFEFAQNVDDFCWDFSGHSWMFCCKISFEASGNTDARTSENFRAYILYWVGSKSIIPWYLDIFGRMNIRFPPRVNQGTRVLTHSHPRMFSPGSDFQGQTPSGAWQAWHEHCGSWNVLKSKMSDNHNYYFVFRRLNLGLGLAWFTTWSLSR